MTIATNMAGRGVDIKLGGSPEQMAVHELKKRGINPGDEGYEETLRELNAELEPQTEAEADEVRELGGLFICGTERHGCGGSTTSWRGFRASGDGRVRFFLSARTT